MCAIDYFCPLTPNLYVETLAPPSEVIKRQAFVRWLGHEGGAFLSGNSALIKETTGDVLVFLFSRKLVYHL